MTVQPIQPKNQILNTNIYIDYESVRQLLKRYCGNPVKLDFFRIILDRYRKIYRLNIVDCIVYCNFETETFPRGQQAVLQNYGIQFRHVAGNHRNCSNLVMATDVVTTLYKNPKIHKFVIIFSGWNIMPLLKQIKSENKSADAIFTRTDFEPGISEFVEHYEYIEDIIHREPEMAVLDEKPVLNVLADQAGHIDNYNSISVETVELLFYSSNEWWGVIKKQVVRFH